jgi:hypothetical protein
MKSIPELRLSNAPTLSRSFPSMMLQPISLRQFYGSWRMGPTGKVGLPTGIRWSHASESRPRENLIFDTPLDGREVAAEVGAIPVVLRDLTGRQRDLSAGKQTIPVVFVRLAPTNASGWRRGVAAVPNGWRGDFARESIHCANSILPTREIRPAKPRPLPPIKPFLLVKVCQTATISRRVAPWQ